MEDFTALAGSLSGSVGDARGVLILSRDGLLLGAYPPDAESQLKSAWLHFASLGEPERGFVQFGTEIWSYVRRGAYAAFVVAATSVRPGLVLDQIEMVLLAAEDARSKREGLRGEPPAPPAPAAPSSKPRTPLHPETRPVAQPPAVIRAEIAPTVSVNVTRVSSRGDAGEPQGPEGTPGPKGDAAAPPDLTVVETPVEPGPSGPSGMAPGGASPKPVPPETAGSKASPTPPAPPAPRTSPSSSRGAGGSSVWGPSDEGTDDEGSEEVDRFSLAREFSQLLQEDSDGADG